jgi:hypothetical protein
LHLVDLERHIGELFTILGETPDPRCTRLCPALANAGSEVLPNTVGNQELRVLRPAVCLLNETDFFVTQRLPMGCGCVLLVRRPVSDMAVEHNEGRPSLSLFEDIQRVLDALDVVGVSDP